MEFREIGEISTLLSFVMKMEDGGLHISFAIPSYTLLSMRAKLEEMDEKVVAFAWGRTGGSAETKVSSRKRKIRKKRR